MHLQAFITASGNESVCEHTFLDVRVVMLQMCHQVSECKFSPCGGRFGVFLEGDALCRKCNSFTSRLAR